MVLFFAFTLSTPRRRSSIRIVLNAPPCSRYLIRSCKLSGVLESTVATETARGEAVESNPIKYSISASESSPLRSVFVVGLFLLYALSIASLNMGFNTESLDDRRRSLKSIVASIFSLSAL